MVADPHAASDREASLVEQFRPLGPGAAAWYVTSDLRGMLLAIRALVLQVGHPMVGAAVYEHSVYKTDPYGRLWRSITSLLRQVIGGYRTAEEGERLMRLHTEIKGVDAQGRRYHALDPGAFLWVHATMFEAWRWFLRECGPGLTDAQEQQLFDEWRRVGGLIGVKPRLLPDTIAEFDAYWDAMLPTLEDGPVVQDLLYIPPNRPPYVPMPQPVFNALTKPLLTLQRSFVAETLPPELAERFGLFRSAKTAKHTRGLITFARALGWIPPLLRRSPFATLAMRRTSRDPRTIPEPIAYP
ncbi:MAG: oxygenase MpaB family protein [Aeromicrobium sp.]